MKRIISMCLLSSLFAVIPAMPADARAASTVSNYSDLKLNAYEYSAFETELKPCPRGTVKVRRKISTKKKLLNTAIAGGVGAAIGGGVGGKRGALIGVGSGAGGYLLYRYVRDRRGRCVLRRA